MAKSDLSKPVFGLQAGDVLEVQVARCQGRAVLKGKRRNPEIVLRNRSAGLFQESSKSRVKPACFNIRQDRWHSCEQSIYSLDIE